MAPLLQSVNQSKFLPSSNVYIYQFISRIVFPFPLTVVITAHLFVSSDPTSCQLMYVDIQGMELLALCSKIKKINDIRDNYDC